MKLTIFTMALALFGSLVAGCGGMSAEDAVAEICACASEASSQEELKACTDESSPEAQAMKAYVEKLREDGMTKEEVLQEPLAGEMAECVMKAGFRLLMK